MITIVIAEDQEMLLGVISSLLNLEEDMEVVGQASNGLDALTLVRQLQPDVCIMDVEMPKMNGIEVAEALVPTKCKVIMLTTFARNGYFERAKKAGVKGFLLKDRPSKELVHSIRSIMDGRLIFSSELDDLHSSDNDHESKEVEAGVDGKVKKQPRTTMGTVRHYLTVIKNKMRLPSA